MDLQVKQYRKNLSKSNEENHFLSPWGGVICRNCDDLGDLLSFKNIAQYKESDKPLWLVLSLVLFRENVRQRVMLYLLHWFILLFFRGKFSQSTPAVAVQVWNLFKECTWIRVSKTCWIYNVFIPKLQPPFIQTGRIIGQLLIQNLHTCLTKCSAIQTSRYKHTQTKNDFQLQSNLMVMSPFCSLLEQNKNSLSVQG